MELEQAFRIMALELGQQLSQGECQQIAYISSCVPEPAPPGYDSVSTLCIQHFGISGANWSTKVGFHRRSSCAHWKERSPLVSLLNTKGSLSIKRCIAKRSWRGEWSRKRTKPCSLLQLLTVLSMRRSMPVFWCSMQNCTAYAVCIGK